MQFKTEFISRKRYLLIGGIGGFCGVAAGSNSWPQIVLTFFNCAWVTAIQTKRDSRISVTGFTRAFSIVSMVVG
jgi:hypothetical protein